MRALSSRRPGRTARARVTAALRAGIALAVLVFCVVAVSMVIEPGEMPHKLVEECVVQGSTIALELTLALVLVLALVPPSTWHRRALIPRAASIIAVRFEPDVGLAAAAAPLRL